METPQSGLFGPLQDGELELVEAMLEADPSVFQQRKGRTRLSALHVAAVEDPLMLAAINGRIACVQKLIQAGANILMFDSLNGRTCLHYAAYYGHADCLQAILSAAHSSLGFSRFVNIRDAGGATPLHLAARQSRPECVHALLDNGALVCASTGGYGYPGSTPLHLAARGGSLDCVRELLAWGADRLQLDASGRLPYTVALRRKNRACAAVLNPSSAEPLVWPSPLKFISELNPEAKALLERALTEANMEREKAILKEAVNSLPSPLHSDAETDDNASEASDVDLCCICFDQLCTIEVGPCGHQMCAHCTLALCCHKKPDPSTTCPTVPVCPFCRTTITQLVVANFKANNDVELEMSPSKPRRSRKSNVSEGSSSFKGLSPMSSFGRMGGRSSGKIAAETNEEIHKP
ncbi:XB3 ortholog 1 in Arabidopsis thaliana [Prunus dulcis]|uniref:RING-type E3 ubiquitin transferase n=1 Tax=Prunus dulcis TaxID=3755 RepID=A0A4Y1RP27_PRUDU|nr:XB3 ortholog 1 in Arabidopsis thaliana [Prunus dulcis]